MNRKNNDEALRKIKDLEGIIREKDDLIKSQDHGIKELTNRVLTLRAELEGRGVGNGDYTSSQTQMGSKRQRMDESGEASSSAVAELEAKLEASATKTKEVESNLEACLARIKELEESSGLAAMNERVVQFADAVEALIDSGAIVDGRFADMRMKLIAAQAAAVVAEVTIVFVFVLL